MSARPLGKRQKEIALWVYREIVVETSDPETLRILASLEKRGLVRPWRSSSLPSGFTTTHELNFLAINGRLS